MNNFHVFLDFGAAGEHGLFLFAVPQANLTVQTIAVPAEIAVGNAFHREVLKAAQQRVVFGNLVNFAADLDFDQFFEGFENVFVIFKIHRGLFSLFGEL
jgi:hypothetical protein